MSSSYNTSIVNAQIRAKLVEYGIPHDPNPSVLSTVDMGDDEWSVEVRYSGLKYPVHAHVRKNYLDNGKDLRVATFRLVTLPHIGADPPWLRTAPKPDETPASMEPPGLAAVPEPEE